MRSVLPQRWSGRVKGGPCPERKPGAGSSWRLRDPHAAASRDQFGAADKGRSKVTPLAFYRLWLGGCAGLRRAAALSLAESAPHCPRQHADWGSKVRRKLACAVYGSRQNGLIRPVLKHGPRSLTYMRVFGWQTRVRNESELDGSLARDAPSTGSDIS